MTLACWLKPEQLLRGVLLVLSALFIVIFFSSFTHLFLVKQRLHLETRWITLTIFFLAGTRDDVVYLMPYHI